MKNKKLRVKLLVFIGLIILIVMKNANAVNGMSDLEFTKSSFIYENPNKLIGTALSIATDWKEKFDDKKMVFQVNAGCFRHAMSGSNSSTKPRYIYNIIDIIYDEGYQGYRIDSYGSGNISRYGGVTAGKLTYIMDELGSIRWTGEINGKKYTNSTFWPSEGVNSYREAAFFRVLNGATGTSNNALIKVNDMFETRTEPRWGNRDTEEQYNAFVASASSYAKSIENFERIAAVGSRDFTLGDDFILGPFRLTYAGTGVGSVSILGDGKSVSGTESWSTSKTGQYSTNLYRIPNNQDFYLKVSKKGQDVDFSQYDNIKVTFNQEGIPIYRSRIALLGSLAHYQQTYCFDMTYDGRLGSSVSYNITAPKGIITINKRDAHNATPLSAGFKIKTSTGWLRGTSGNYTYNSTKANGQIYTTNPSTGTITLTEIIPGRYEVYEVTPPASYVLSRQVGYNSTENYVQIGTAQTIARSETITFNGTNRKVGNLTINKTDADDPNIKLSAGFKIKTPDGGWLKGQNGNYTYNNTKANGDIYTTNATTGTVTLRELKIGNYEVYEVTAPTGYKLDKQEEYNSAEQYLQLETAKTLTDGETITFTGSNRLLGNIIITKQSAEDESIKLEGVKFKINKNGSGYLNKTDGKNRFVSDIGEATEFTTDANGIATIPDIPLGTYTIYETESIKNYTLSMQQGYDRVARIRNCGDLSITRAALDQPTTISNREDKVRIAGYVWVDGNDNKGEQYNNLFDGNNINGDYKLGGVAVKLKLKSNPSDIIAQATTGADGSYMIDYEIRKTQLNNYYVEFDYSGTTYKERYIPVAIDTSAANGSRAIMDTVATRDADLTGIATTYAGTNDGTEGNYGLSGLIEENGSWYSNEILTNINLGILPIPEAQHGVEEGIDYVKLEMGSYTYKYKYGTRGNSAIAASPTINWRSALNATRITRDIYPSEVVYNAEHANTLKVYVVYKIDVTDTTFTEKEYLYKESKLNVTKLTNTYDTERYILETSKDSDTNAEIGKWTGAGGTATYNLSNETSPFRDGVAKGATKTTYIEFRVKDEAIKQILENPSGISETNPTKTSVEGYHTYTRRDYSWTNNVTKLQTHETRIKEATAQAPYLIFRLGEERQISGTVFEDKIVTGNGTEIGIRNEAGEALGNGQKDSEEKGVQGVKVELIDATTLKIATKYLTEDIEGTNKKKATIQEEGCTTTTDENGNYTLAGMIPGEYYLRFTYGDGTQQIVGGEAVKSKEYKSTIVTSEVTKKALKNSGNTYGNEWYKHLEGTNYSIAVDDIKSRVAANEKEEATNLYAETAKLSITLENTEDNERDEIFTDKTNVKIGSRYSEIEVKTPEGVVQVITKPNGNTTRLFGAMNFGLIKWPKQGVEMEKIITNMELTNADGNRVFIGNPEKDQMKGVTDLDGITNNGSTFTRVELNEEEIYGSNLRITYDIKVTNISDLNYYGTNYYRYGETTAEKNDVVVLNLEKVKDYLDETLSINKDKMENSVTEATGTRPIDNKEYKEITVDTNSIIYPKEYTLVGEDKQSYTFKVVAERKLGVTDDDLYIVNRVKTSTVNIVANPTDTTNTEEQKEELIKTIVNVVDTSPEAKAELTITPPTGSDKQKIIVISISLTVVAIVLAAGIIIIKKKVI